MALAINSRLLSESEKKVFAATLDRVVTADSGDHIGTGIHGTRYLLKALTDCGFGEKAFTVASQVTFPGWGYMVKEGATTLWERWEKIESPGMNSHNHIMLGSVDLWFYNYVAGLDISPFGYRNIILRPGIFRKISNAAARILTPSGPVEISWEKDETGIKVYFKIPPGCRGILFAPEGFYVSVIESRPSSGEIKSIGFKGRKAPEIDSGWYYAEITPDK